MNSISRVLVANRGEIAVRIIKACQALGLETVAALSEADLNSTPAKMADRVICIGPPHASQSYLNIPAIISAAIGTNAQAIHPGYGFLSEQPELPRLCKEHNIIFIGPPADIIEQMGNKLFARKVVQKMGISVTPGSDRVYSYDEAILLAEKIGFPILLKAAAGGGGRGMRIAMSADELKGAFEAAAGEAHAAFGDNTVYIEKYIPDARHIEVQILADNYGNVVHLGERECSLQRRYQKVIEEAPASLLPLDIRKNICEAAVSIARHIQYENSGTIEFIYDKDSGQYYFLEMNTRIQVEHPVTEMITGIDIVQHQIRIAAKETLALSQPEIEFNGHAIECRVNAESPKNGFMPNAGKINEWRIQQNNKTRVDTHCYSGYSIPPYFDSLLAKIITTGNDRTEAIHEMQSVLRDSSISGVETTIPFLQFLISHPDYYEGKTNTRWLEEVSGCFTSLNYSS